MSERKLLELLQTQAKLLAGMSSAQLATERIVLALIETHPDKPALLARIHAQLEINAVSDLYAAQQAELVEAGEQQRDRLLRSIHAICKVDGET
jgi:hypothetical protein